MSSSWQTELANAHKSLTGSHYPSLIPPFLNDLIQSNPASDSLKNQFIPSDQEYIFNDRGLEDPIGDEKYAVAPGLIHRYQNRVLFTPTQSCPVNCRYCFRKNELGKNKEFLKTDKIKIVNYLKAHPEINELIFTGGDPLILSDEKIKDYLSLFSEIDHLKFIRFHTRTISVLPSRVTDDFINILVSFKNRFLMKIVIHMNHTDEWSEAFEEKIEKLSHAGIELLSQSVLLKGVNDNAEELRELFMKLSSVKIRPYYLHHPDLVKGAMHFYLTLKEGRKIYAKLRNCLPGWALPNYIIDIPGGDGKTPAFNPEAFDFSGKLINRQGLISNVSSQYCEEI